MINGKRIFQKTLNSIILIGLLVCPMLAQVDQVKINYDRLSDRVLVVWGGEVYKDQVVAISTQKGIVMIDSGKSPTLTAEYRKIIQRELGREDFIYVINTHFHFDHSSGNQVFPEADVIAHRKSPAMMTEWAAGRQNWVDSRRKNALIRWTNQRDSAEPGSEQWKRFNDIVTSQIVMLDDYENNYKLTLPTITFGDRMALDLGDVRLKLYHWGEGLHTGDDILIFCPEEKILFSGDLFYKKSFNFTFSAKFNGKRQISILDDIFDKENSVQWVYDCHNGRMTGSYISLYHKYMKDIWTSLTAAKERNETFNTVRKGHTVEKRFAYIDKSGLDRAALKRSHASNLELSWYSIHKSQSAADLLSKIIDKKGIDPTLEKYNHIKDQPEEKYFFNENDFNRLGYRLMNGGKLKEAIWIFKINVEKFPESANVYDSLGEAYMKAEEKKLAIINYEKSLKLNPDNANAKDMLKQLRKNK